MVLACTFSNLTLSLYTSAGSAGADTIAVTLYKNGSPTLLTTSCSNPAATTTFTICSDTLHTVPVGVGDVIGYGFTQTNNAPTVRMGIGVKCQ